MSLNTFNTVSIGEAARRTGVSIKQIRHWADRGYIKPPQRVVCGERSYRQFTDRDLEVISVIKRLIDEGFTVKAAASICAKQKIKKEEN
ncbi:MAG: MerR family transcriptional regulator [Desulfobulbaceae bacterium]|nr:MerR family transcriptional regulator [Desulfobulbaceae bacterium]